jgi:hypothetical protein
MLVRIAAGDEPAELGLDQLAIRVLRVRHPVPACHRMRITRPLVVIVDESVREADRAMLMEEAHNIGAALFPLGPLVRQEALGKWLRDAIQFVLQRRADRGDDIDFVAAEG